MEISEITTAGDYRSYLKFLSKDIAEMYQGTLEEYLHSLLKVVQKYKGNQVTFALLATVLLEAFTTEPLPFDEQFLEYQSPPDFSEDDTDSVKDDFECLQHLLFYQIADFHLLEASGVLQKQWSVLGVTSPTGHSWYNFTPKTFLFCAASGMHGELTATDCTWVDLAITLWLGQIYE